MIAAVERHWDFESSYSGDPPPMPDFATSVRPSFSPHSSGDSPPMPDFVTPIDGPHKLTFIDPVG